MGLFFSLSTLIIVVIWKKWNQFEIKWLNFKLFLFIKGFNFGFIKYNKRTKWYLMLKVYIKFSWTNFKHNCKSYKNICSHQHNYIPNNKCLSGFKFVIALQNLEQNMPQFIGHYKRFNFLILFHYYTYKSWIDYLCKLNAMKKVYNLQGSKTKKLKLRNRGD